jgi:lipopolysaccharide export LptBFGC system permease protein LptF
MNLYCKIRDKISFYIKKPIEPPSYEIKRIILNNYKKEYGLNVLVETGTFMGDTVDFFKNTFEHVFSIELSEDLAFRAKMRFKNDENVTILQGDSGEMLKDIVKNASEPMLFWLDGHYSSEFYIGNEYIKTAKTNVNTPVKEELKVILLSNLNHVILIDDARLFNGNNDYPTIHEMKKIVKELNKKYEVKVENDIIRVTVKK